MFPLLKKFVGKKSLNPWQTFVYAFVWIKYFMYDYEEAKIQLFEEHDQLTEVNVILLKTVSLKYKLNRAL